MFTSLDANGNGLIDEQELAYLCGYSVEAPPPKQRVAVD